ncbi:hypothetical protein Scel_35680 [Streptomyces cellostaticus]|uniref:DUF6542 domain-containing protein n=2 Tax=Streptomyces cellostaticus TaxID=67285 RepID=UPI001ABF6067|nr:DUF6542 domain-containing protein [Streptomyces cellostaticus]GHI05247.1 hypothetical protein Scel_35680 [Streptomyces cellostaticus]
MEQRRTRPPNGGRRRGAPPAPLPPQARRQTGERRPAPGAERAARPVSQGGIPGPRLTGLGGGLFCVTVMVLLGFLDQLLFGGSLTLYGVLFVPVAVLTALWVRGGDLLTAPVVVPIAFAVGLFPVADGSGGLLGRLMGLVTGLATQAGWLYGGTLIAGVIVLVRRVRWVRSRRRRS